MPARALVFLCLCLSATSAHAGAAAIQLRALALGGDPAPGGNGKFSDFLGVCLNEAGQVVFNADLSATSGGFNADDSGIYVTMAEGGTIQEVARADEPAPDGNGYFVPFFGNSNIRINSSGQVAFQAKFDATFGVNTDNYGMLRGDPDHLVTIARGRAYYRGPLSLDEADEVAFPDNSSILRGDGTAASSVIVTDGEPTPDGQATFIAGVDSISNAAMNASGKIAFRAAIHYVTAPHERYGVFVADGTTITAVAITGTASPDGNGVFSNFSNPAINDAGDVAFLASLTATSGSLADNTGVFRRTASGLSTIARRGQTAPDGNGKLLDLLSPYSGTEPSNNVAINESGQVAFVATITGATGGATKGVFRGDGSTLEQIVRLGDLAPDGVSTFASGSGYDFGSPSLNDSGQVAFMAGLLKSGVITPALILYDDDAGLVQVARTGDALGGSTIEGSFEFHPNVTSNGKTRRGLNNSGEMVFKVFLASGKAAIGFASVGGAVCGNDVVESGEQCDDGDTAYAPGDYCQSGCAVVPCGQPVNPDKDSPRTSDALFVLKVAISAATCDVRVCDVIAPAGIKTSDALALLKRAVGAPIAFSCPS